MGFSFNTRKAKNLLLWRNAVLHQDIDCAILVDGAEGGGKSVEAQQVAAFLDIEHHIDIETQMCFTPQQFKDSVTSLKKGKAIIWDEARRGVNRRRSTQDVNLEITDMLAECRQNNLFLVIVMPSFYDMDMNVAVWRSRALIHVWYDWNVEEKEQPLVRGFFRFYNEEGKKRLYTNKLLRTQYSYPYIKDHCFDGTFTNHYVVDESSYREKKKAAELLYRKGGGRIKVQKDDEELKREIVGDVVGWLNTNRWLKKGSLTALSGYLGVSDKTIRNWCSGSGIKEDTTGSVTTNGRGLTHKKLEGEEGV